MKTRKKISLILSTALLIMPEIIGATEYVKCGGDNRFPLLFTNMTATFVNIIKILVPIFLVIGGMISFFKVTISSNVEEDLKKAKNTLINRIIAAVVIFFTLSIINFAVSLVAGTGSKLMDCVNCFMNPEKCQKVSEDNSEKICPGFISDQSRYDENCNLIDKEGLDQKRNDVDYIDMDNIEDNSSNTNNNTPFSYDNFLFIGDSRYVGISSQLKEFGQNITVSAVVGKSASDWLNNTTGEYALPDNASGISVMLGVNNPSDTITMKQLLNRLHEKYPSAIIYINSVYNVGTAYRGSVTNEQIANFNNEMSLFASQNSWSRYVDVTNGLNDRYNFIKSEYTNDGLHLNEIGQQKLIENIRNNVR